MSSIICHTLDGAEPLLLRALKHVGYRGMSRYRNMARHIWNTAFRAASVDWDDREGFSRLAAELFAGIVLELTDPRRAALLNSLVHSGALFGVPPFNYRKDVLPRVATHPHRFIGQRTPAACAETFDRHRVAA